MCEVGIYIFFQKLCNSLISIVKLQNKWWIDPSVPSIHSFTHLAIHSFVTNIFEWLLVSFLLLYNENYMSFQVIFLNHSVGNSPSPSICIKPSACLTPVIASWVVRIKETHKDHAESSRELFFFWTFTSAFLYF